MLDLQRYKGNTLRQEVRFTRIVLWAHLGLGILVVLLLLLHELFGWAAAATGWYLISVMLIGGLLSGAAFCRWGLGLSFLAFALAGVFFLGQVLPGLSREHSPLLPYAVLRIWLGGANLVYVAGGLLMLGSQHIRKAAGIGFKLW
jgi:signal transduction histidine kinase